MAREGGRTYGHDAHELVVLLNVTDLGVKSNVSRTAIHQDVTRDVAQVVLTVRRGREGGRDEGREGQREERGEGVAVRRALISTHKVWSISFLRHPPSPPSFPPPCSYPARVWSREDLPQPDGPITAVMVPLLITP